MTIMNADSNKITIVTAFYFDFIYHVDRVFGIYHLCIPIWIVSEIIVIIYDKSYQYFKPYNKIISWFEYIHGLTKLLGAFIPYYRKCLALQTKRYTFYDSFQVIHLPPILFHNLTFNLVLALLLSVNSINLLMLVTYKFPKSIISIVCKNNWLAKDQSYALL